MIDRHGIKAFVLLAALFVSFSYNVAANTIHTVVKGDTVFSISRLHKISQEDLMRVNGISDPSKLLVGMRLVIPANGNNPPALTSAYTEYTVLKNDTLYSIARTSGVTLQALRDINGFSKNHVLKAGEKIKIPQSTQVAPAPVPPQPVSRPPARVTERKADTAIRWPVAATEVLYMNGNAGVLVSGRESESIKSLTAGIVVHASPWRGYGNVAVVETDGGYRYLYGSCETLSVKKGDNVEPGTELGKLGIYWASGKPDLVFIVSQDGLPVDPAKAPRF
ncbi:MAG: M23 family metallopeptidase [Treponema sp.]|nr:M23 family metallopeptidase [Treponema sp.]